MMTILLHFMCLRENVFSEHLFLNSNRSGSTFSVLELSFTEQILLNLSLISKMTNLRDQHESIGQFLGTTLAKTWVYRYKYVVALCGKSSVLL